MTPDDLHVSDSNRLFGEPDSTAAHAVLHTGRLVLTPSNPHLIPDVGLLVEGLAQSGFLSAALECEAGLAFAIGSNFLSLLAFAGCAVQLRDEPDTGVYFSHIRIPPVSPHPRLMVGRNTRSPRCPGCRAPLPDWRERVEHWATHPHAGVRCASCGETRPPWLWDWKQRGGFGRVFVQVEEVFPGEAVPTPAFLEQLIRISATGWRHFYIQD